MVQLAGQHVGNQGKLFKVESARGICVRTVSAKIEKISAILLSQPFRSSCRIDRIATSVSCRSGLPIEFTIAPENFAVHLNTEGRPYAAEPYTFQRNIRIASQAHPLNKRNSMGYCCLSLMSIVTFRFWQLRNGHKNPLCGVVIFGMQNLNVITYEVFGNELG
jgi:hypothetical protein